MAGGSTLRLTIASTLPATLLAAVLVAAPFAGTTTTPLARGRPAAAGTPATAGAGAPAAGAPRGAQPSLSAKPGQQAESAVRTPARGFDVRWAVAAGWRLVLFWAALVGVALLVLTAAAGRRLWRGRARPAQRSASP